MGKTRNIAEGAAQGSKTLADKAGQMASSWSGAKSRMKTGFAAYGFGPTRTANYNSGIDRATYKAPDPSKWASRWSTKMGE